MRLQRIRGGRVLALMLVLAPVAIAQQPSTVLRAHAMDATTGAPIAGAEISVVGRDRKARTDSTGVAIISGIAAGDVAVEARRVGFAPLVVQVTIPARDTVDAVFALHSTTQALPTMTTLDSANSHAIPEFEARLKSHIGGYFVTDSAIRKNQSSTIANLLRSKVPGVKPIVNPDQSTYLVSTRGVDKCYVLTFLDGIRLLDKNIGIVGLESLAAIEYYPPGYAPVQYRPPPAIEPKPIRGSDEQRGPRAECGVLLLWTRR